MLQGIVGGTVVWPARRAYVSVGRSRAVPGLGIGNWVMERLACPSQPMPALRWKKMWGGGGESAQSPPTRELSENM